MLEEGLCEIVLPARSQFTKEVALNVKAQLSAAGLLLLVALAAPAGEADVPLLDAPESAYWDAGSDTWFVSNLGGGLSLAKDGVGWVTRFDAEGQVLAPRWADGLDAPTGMASHAGRLYVADRGCVRIFDIASAQPTGVVALPGGEFVNDVAIAGDGAVFVSDTATNRIYRLTGDGAELWLETDALQNPNGLWVDGAALVVASWGPMTDVATFAAKHPGTLLRIDLATKEITPVGRGEPIANFDGVLRIGEYYYATDWTGGRLLRIADDGSVETLLSGFSQLADLGYDAKRGIVGLPIMSDNRFVRLRLTLP